MENLLQDFRFGFRTLAKNPAFTLVAIIALALGTGANTAIFSVVNAVLLRPLPYGDPDRLMMVWGHNIRTGDKRFAISIPDYNDYCEQNTVFEQIASLAYEDFNLKTGAEPEHVQGTVVSSNFFDTLGVGAALGRTFSPDDGKPGADRVVVINNGLWKRRFGSDLTIIGRTIQLNSASFEVIGVTPPNFQSPEKGDELWITMSFDGGDRMRVPSVISPESLKVRNARFVKCVGRVKPGVSATQAQEDLSRIASILEADYPDKNAGFNVNVISMSEQVVGNNITAALVTLLIAVGLVLLIACANVANLLLARATSRQKEIAVRIALGAWRKRLVRQLLTESVLLGLFGGALGLLLAFGGIKLLVAINPANIPRLDEINIDAKVLIFTLMISILTGLIFGLIPALQASKPNLNETLKAEGERGSTGGIGKHLRSLLVISEVGITVLLLISAGLMIKSFITLQKVNPGFNPDNVLTMQVNLPTITYTEERQLASFYEQVLKRIEQIPTGVQSAGASTILPLMDRKFVRRFVIDGRAPATPDERLTANHRSISPNYLQTMGIPLIQGRGFTDQDRDKSQPVILINDFMRRRYWPNDDALGKHITLPSDGPISREIIGIVADVKHTSLRDPSSGAEMYVPYLQKPYPFMGLVIRANGEPTGMIQAVREAVSAVDPSQSVYDIKTMQQMVNESVSQPRLYAVLIGVFAGVALALAAVGIYGVLNYTVYQRRHEIGIRMALGAQPSDILKMIVGQGMRLAAIGLLIGLIAAVILAIFLTSLIEGFLFEVSSTDLTIFIGIPLLLALVALLSCYIPARRATKVDPMVALRAE